MSSSSRHTRTLADLAPLSRSLLVPYPTLALQTELRSVVNYKIWRDATRDITKPEEFATSHYDRPTMRKCWDFLDQTSRSFSMVIKELEGDLARTVSRALNPRTEMTLTLHP